MTDIRKLAEKLIDQSDKELQELRKILKETYNIKPKIEKISIKRK